MYDVRVSEICSDAKGLSTTTPAVPHYYNTKEVNRVVTENNVPTELYSNMVMERSVDIEYLD